MSKNKNKIHVERLRQIRPFVEFDFNINDIKKGNLSNYDKSKIKKYYDLINTLKSQPHYDYKPRKREYREQAKEAFGIKGFNKLRVVPIPTAENGERPNIRRVKNKLIIGTDNVERVSFLFDKLNLLKSVEGEVNRILNQMPKGFKRWGVMIGFTEIKRTFESKRALIEYIDKLLWRYGLGENQSNNMIEHMTGIVGYKFINQATFSEYLALKDKESDDLKRQRRNKKAREKRARNRI